jgi:NAD+ kinase
MANPTAPPDPQQLAFQHIGVLYHPRLAESRVMAAEILEFIESMGVSAWASPSWDGEPIDDRLKEVDLLIVLGGDGSMIRAARLAAGQNIPILGVNMGRLGFLTEIQPAEWPSLIKKAVLGEYWVEQRMMVHAEHRRGSQLLNSYEALNEIAVSRSQLDRVVRLDTYIDHGFLTTYTADGLIVSTATGSTAYALAAGGPILPPELENFLLVPLAPHLSLDRALVLSKGVTLRIQVSAHHTAVLTADGQFGTELANEDEVILSAGSRVGRFVRLKEKNYFYQTLIDRLGWPQPERR